MEWDLFFSVTAGVLLAPLPLRSPPSLGASGNCWWEPSEAVGELISDCLYENNTKGICVLALLHPLIWGITLLDPEVIVVPAIFLPWRLMAEWMRPFGALDFVLYNSPSSTSHISLGSSPGLGRSPGEANGNPLQYCCLENPMDRRACQAAVCGVAKSWTRLTDFTSLHKRRYHLCLIH